MNLEIELLRSFSVAAETLNFSVAGEQLGRVQSAVSAHIKKLEYITGQVLFERGRGKAMTLTPSGEALLASAHQMLRLNDRALRALRPETPSATLRFGTTETYALTLLPRALSLFTRLHPDVETSAVCATSPELLVSLDSGDLDLILVTDQGRRAGRTLVRRERLAWAAGRGFGVAPDEPVPLALMPPGCEFRSAGLKALDEMGRPWRLAMSSPSPMGVRAALLADLAVTVLPTISIDGSLRALGDAEGLPPLGSVSVVAYRPARGVDPATRASIEQFLSLL